MQPSLFSLIIIIKVLRRNELLDVLSHEEHDWADVKRRDGQTGYVYAPTLKPLYTSEWPGPTRHVVFAPKGDHLRSGPFIESDIRTLLPKETSVWVLREVDVWSYVVTDDGGRGYIATKLLRAE
jgi:hypothetical protein